MITTSVWPWTTLSFGWCCQDEVTQIPVRSVTHLLVVAVASSGVYPSTPDPLPCWLGVLGTGGNPSLRLQPPFPVPLPSPLSAIPGLGQPCTPWLTLPGSIPTYAQQAGSSATMRKVRNLRNPWVSVQDVVLNSLESSLKLEIPCKNETFKHVMFQLKFEIISWKQTRVPAIHQPIFPAQTS